MSPMSEKDIYLFNEGTHHRLYHALGSHPGTRDGSRDGEAGTWFAVWAPNAAQVAVMGDWNDWNKTSQPLALRGESGVWEGFLPGVGLGARYKYHVVSKYPHPGAYRADKADPFALHTEVPPAQASVVWDLGYEWGDKDWMAGRADRQSISAPLSIYEVHLGSWRRVALEGGTEVGVDDRPLTYREIAGPLAEHVKKLGFTHVELLPVTEHPYYGSWGYQTTGYFAPTSRYGSPQDFMHLVDHLHQEGIGVILDWVPSHFPTDEFGLGYFDGTHLYEHADPRQGFHPDWGSYIFNYDRNEVRAFLISSAAFWLDRYHIDGLRVDAVASMLYLDYSRKDGEWIPNRHGGRENLGASAFLRACNDELTASFPGTLTLAEESTSWPMVSRPTAIGGLGFGYKWDMGWMHDNLKYLALDPLARKHHHRSISFRMIYAWNENFVLPLSHDEVVHGKGSLLNKMPGDTWQKLANLRLLYGSMYAQPGKKLLFMGAELAPWREWDHESSLDWHLLDDPAHAGICRWLEDLNRLHRDEPALHQLDAAPEGFEWIDADDALNSVFTFLRKGQDPKDVILVVINFTPVIRGSYRVGVPHAGHWTELLNSDDSLYGGSGVGNPDGVEAVATPLNGRSHSITLRLPPLGVLFLKAPALQPRS